MQQFAMAQAMGGCTGCPSPAVASSAVVQPAPAASGPAGDVANAGAAPQEPATEREMAMYAAAAAAQQAQYLQQYQFWQQMNAQEAERLSQSASSTGGGGSSSSSAQPSRFKDNFRPMRLCKHLVTLGLCRQGSDCTFAHSYDELHPASSDMPKVEKPAATSALAEQGEVPESNVPDVRLKKKREMCGRFSRGECSLGKVCPFAHSEEELGTVGLVVCGKVKTRLCIFWESGKCIYGTNCNNAHGEKEIGTKRPPREDAAGPPKRRKNGEPAGHGKL